MNNLLAHAIEIGAKLDENLRCDAFAFANQSKQDVLSADVVVAELQSFTERELEYLLGARREWNVSTRGLLSLPNDLFHLSTYGL